MRIETAIEILTGHREASDGDLASALALAIEALREQDERRQAQIDEAEKMISYLLDGSERERVDTWRMLRSVLTLPEDVLEEVEIRLDLRRVDT